ncbi:PepSY domain-containing protein [Pusillimonas caeni]|uniref:PepSY-associated TM helix domain-containing protein n=1 Tax=Pusillimonas caeni TaxID=1348472 RepID=UPI000E5A0934|nr:PepSY-associated TM helix domain-containing protein [Pusillimonas caeni]TFL15416.1 PepSY domain-containing protein [Pusillimonas caeni]
MKEGFRQCMAWLHTWTGLVAGWVLFFVFVTGTAGYFNYEIDRWMRPELPLATASDLSSLDTRQAIEKAQAYLQANYPKAEFWNIGLPVERTQPQFSVFAREARKPDGSAGRVHNAHYDPASGDFTADSPARATGGGQLLYRMHYLLHYVPDEAGIWAVGVCTMLMLIAIVSGVITHKKIFVDFFTFRRAKGQRSWLDAHNLVSVTALPFFIMITYSGLVFFMTDYMPAGVQASYQAGEAGRRQLLAELVPASYIEPSGQAAPLTALSDIVRQAERHWNGAPVSGMLVRNPGDASALVTVRAQREGRDAIGIPRLVFDGATGEISEHNHWGGALETRDVLLSLHEGRFAGLSLRWLYFLASLLGCAMIATGLVLWTAKRKAKQEKRLKAGQSMEFGYRLVRCLNVGAIAGLPVAMAAYFWANRLIPAEFADRRAWEAHAMFIVWGVTLVYPAFRSHLQAWVDELRLAALAFALLPLVNALTTQRHLGVTLPAGDWVLAGFDLVMLGLGAVFAYAAHEVSRKRKAPRQAPKNARHGAGVQAGEAS